MTEQKRDRGIKILVKAAIWIEGDDKQPKKIPVGTVVTLTKEQVKHYGVAVTRDLPDGEDE